MRRLAILVGTIVGVAAGVLIASTWLAGTTAQNTNSVAVDAYVLTNTDAEPGNECFPWGFVDDSLEVGPFRQVIVTNDHGVVVGVIDLQVGSFVTAENGQQSCTISQTIDLAESPFYTFSVDGKYRRTVSAETIADMDWHIAIHLK